MPLPPERLDLQVNGEARQLPAGSTVVDLLDQMNLAPATAKGIAVAVNDEVVPRARWKDVALDSGDRVEVITARQGG